MERGRFKERRRPPRPGDRAAEEAERQRREAEQRRRSFDEDEGYPEDLGSMLLKLGRRAVAHQLHVARLVNDGRAALQRELLVRALGSEERYLHLTERSEKSRALAREHFGKALALSVDRLSTQLEMQRGQIDYLFGRLKQHLEAQDQMTRLVDRLTGLGEEDIHQATIKSIVLYRLVSELLGSDDTLVQKLSAEERRGLLEFALGLRKEMPDVLSAIFGDIERPPPPRRAEVDADGVMTVERIGVVRFEKIPVERSLKEGHAQDAWSTRAAFALTNSTFEDRPLVFYVGPCIALKDKDWNEAVLGPWPDERFHPRLRFHSGELSWDASEEPPQLPMVETAVCDVAVRWSPWFAEHDQRMRATNPGEGPKSPRKRSYRITIHVPAAARVLLLDVEVDWSVLDG